MTIDTTDRLEMHWVPVTDADGRARMEAVWSTASATSAATYAATHAA